MGRPRKIDSYIPPKKVVRRHFPARVSNEIIERAQKLAKKNDLTLQSYVEGALSMFSDLISKRG